MCSLGLGGLGEIGSLDSGLLLALDAGGLDTAAASIGLVAGGESLSTNRSCAQNILEELGAGLFGLALEDELNQNTLVLTGGDVNTFDCKLNNDKEPTLKTLPLLLR